MTVILNSKCFLLSFCSLLVLPKICKYLFLPYTLFFILSCQYLHTPAPLPSLLPSLDYRFSPKKRMMTVIRPSSLLTSLSACHAFLRLSPPPLQTSVSPFAAAGTLSSDRGGWWRWRASGSFEHSSGCWLWSGPEHQASDTAAAAGHTRRGGHFVMIRKRCRLSHKKTIMTVDIPCYFAGSPRSLADFGAQHPCQHVFHLCTLKMLPNARFFSYFFAFSAD